MGDVVIAVVADAPQEGLLGLYEGLPRTARSDGEGFALPSQISIYQRPHERLARDRAELERLVGETVWHEVAHHFGLDEAEVARAERRQARIGRRRLL
jgi:predicted Zn-dependent protease with MMP-like domain